MRYEAIVNITVDLGSPHIPTRGGKDYHLAFDYTVDGNRVVVNDTRLLLCSKEFDAEWFWNVCPDHLMKALDREMMLEWDRAHHLVLPKVQTTINKGAIA